MNKWKITILALILIFFSVGIFWIFKNKKREVNIFNVVVLPTPTLIDKKVKIAVMADVHSDSEELKIMLNKAKSNGTEIVIVAGDLTNEGKNNELIKIKKVLDGASIKYAVVPGNHEYDLVLFKNIFGKNYQSIKIDEVKLILIDNSYWKGLDEIQKNWIENEVKECKVLICVAIMHKPLNNMFSTHVMGENNKKAADEGVWLRELLISSGVKQIEAGHLHYASSYELEGIRTDIVGAISRDRNNQSPRYTELMISRDLIERNVVEETDDIGN
jgi:predicted phosphodiesterase